MGASQPEGSGERGSHSVPRSLARFMSVLWLPSTILETRKCPHTQGSTHTLTFVRAQTQSRTQMHKHTQRDMDIQTDAHIWYTSMLTL